jgi:hypothetical protein
MKREFDQLAELPVRRVTVHAAALDEIPELVRMAATEIPTLAAAQPAVVRVHTKHPQSVWSFRSSGRLVGVYAMLLLNTEGQQQLLAGALDCSDPPVDCLAEPSEPVAAIYKWAVVARGTAAEGIRAMSRRLQQLPFDRANLYARAIGAAAQRLDFNLGFRPVRPDSDLLIYVRIKNRAVRSPLAA